MPTGFLRCVVALACIVLSLNGRTDAAPPNNSSPRLPDFTKGDLPSKDAHDWNLGPTGMRGWIFAHKLETTDARQIYVTKVDRGSPADGIFEAGDVILGIDGSAFESDARITYAKAIGEAEATDGNLDLLVWRAGKRRELTVKLQQLGAYSDTAPYDCKKSDAIFKQGCDAIAKKLAASGRRDNPIIRSLNTLALLASGNREYMPLIKKEIQWASKYSASSFQTWYYGYVNLMLCEYVQATGDKSVLPQIRKLALASANGQSSVGTWGHKFANPKTGILYGYGAMNSPALTLTMSMAMAKEVGVRSKQLDAAMEKSATYLEFYAGKGSYPYGDHHPWMVQHDPNGKCGMGALLFDLLGKKESAEYFAKMTLAAHGLERDMGHTGNFFCQPWPVAAVSRLGPEATGAWMKEASWRFDLARKWDGSFQYQGNPGMLKKDHSYGGWDCTGAYLMNYAVGKKSLRLTGRKKSGIKPLNHQQTASIIAAGAGFHPSMRSADYSQHDKEDLLRGLTSWSPVVRSWSAKALKNHADERTLYWVMELLKRGKRDPKLGACEALEQMGPKAAPAIPLLARALKADDPWLRVQAGEALAAIGDPALVAAPELLKIAADIDDSDPRLMTQRYIAYVLFSSRKEEGNFRGLLSRSLKGIDPDLLYQAVIAVLQNQDGNSRATVASVYKNLSYEEIKPLLPAIYKATAKQAPSGVMFAARVRLAGLELLSRHNLEEGMPLCIEVMEHDQWGKGNRIPKCLKILESYGTAAKSQIPALRKVESELLAASKAPNKHVLAIRQSIARIEKSTKTRKLRSMPTGSAAM